MKNVVVMVQESRTKRELVLKTFTDIGNKVIAKCSAKRKLYTLEMDDLVLTPSKRIPKKKLGY